MNPSKIKCPNCGYTIGMLTDKRIRKIVSALIKRWDELPSINKETLLLQLNKEIEEAEAEEKRIADKMELERKEYLEGLKRNA